MACQPLTRGDIKEILNNAGPTFLEKIHIEPLFMSFLVQAKVLMMHESQAIQDEAVQIKRCSRLLVHLYTVSARQFVDFCLILCDKQGQKDFVIKDFGLNIKYLRSLKITMAEKRHKDEQEELLEARSIAIENDPECSIDNLPHLTNKKQRDTEILDNHTTTSQQEIPVIKSPSQPSLDMTTLIQCDLQSHVEGLDVDTLHGNPSQGTPEPVQSSLDQLSSHHNIEIKETVEEDLIHETAATSEGIEIIKHLELEMFYPEKISLQDVMAIGDIQLEGTTPAGRVPWTILQKLLMLNKSAVTSEVQNCQTRSQPSVNSFSLDNDFMNIHDTFDDCLEVFDNQLHPSDVFMAIFVCCDLNLRQKLVQNMQQCRLAVPFLFTDIVSNQLSLSLWPLRLSILVWPDSSGKVVEASAVTYPIKIVSCVRLGRPESSKSKFLNNILSDQVQETFLNAESPNGDTLRQSTEGIVEASTCLPSGKENEEIEDPTFFLNLRGDGTKFEKQVDILGQLSNVVLVFIDVSELNNTEAVLRMKLVQKGCKKVVMMLSNKQQYPAEKMKKCLQEYKETIGPAFLKNIQKLHTFRKGREKNVAQISSEVRKLLQVILKHEKGRSLENAFERLMTLDVTIDETNKDCQEGKRLADNVISQIGNDTSKERLIPLQGKHWKEWCEGLKMKKRSMSTRAGDSSILEVSREEQEMKAQRQQQKSLCDQISPFVKAFIDGLSSPISNSAFDFYIKWLKIYLDDISRQKLPELQMLYLKRIVELKSSTNTQAQNDKIKEQLSNLEQNIDAVSLGFEHLMREMGQIYEAVTESRSKAHQDQFNKLPHFAAKLLLRGHSLEIMDGDASGVPLTWLAAVFTELEKEIKDEKLFTLSVLGIQSSGKSTLLNTMFGLQFPVSAGRCTKGVYVQLVKVNPSANLPFSYVAVMDSEGLRGTDLSSRFEYDNQLATFVIGLGNLTLINVKGENLSEIRDILQTVIHAFLRMKMVKKHFQRERKCIFVHQNVPAIDATVKMQSARRKLEGALDQMTVEAAELERNADIRSFNDVIQFDSQKQVWYFPDLWYGDPPMASVHIGYHEKVKDLKSVIFKDLAKYNKHLSSCSQMTHLIRDMWLAILSDNFVFSFRNTTAMKGYEDLDHKFSELKWKLELAVKEWKNKIQLDKAKTEQSLQIQCEDLKRQAAEKIASLKVEVIKELITFIDTHAEREFMYSWKRDKECSLKHFAETLNDRIINDIDEITQKEVIGVFVEMICDEIEELMERTILKHLELEIVKEIVPHFNSKAMLIKAILRDLAKREDFDSYQQYIEDSKKFSRNWLSIYIERYIFRDRSGSSWYYKEAKRIIHKVIGNVLLSVRKTSGNRCCSPHDWIEAFSKDVCSSVPFNTSTAVSLFKGTGQMVDSANLQDRFTKSLQRVQTNTLRLFGDHQMDNINWLNTPPHEQVLNATWGCEAVCPFCKEPCNRSDPNHASAVDCHECIQHRPVGVGACTWPKSTKVAVESCSYKVQSSAVFCCSDTDHECDETEDTDQIFHPYKEYKKYVPDWDIPPSSDMDSSHYWMWYLNKFQVQIAESLEGELADIPPSWKDITKDSAIDSLDLVI